ncbi:sugar transferase [Aurantiacibacter suaedae]|uniref:sugar transferase n=1 Tax=Aurantiacibacter suaedae TaxID=2545755 RepID=UPI001F4FF9F4|nr:sugar transferase [Aurantiacibacter suaedae]
MIIERKTILAPYEPPRLLGRSAMIVDDPLAAQLLDRVGSFFLLIAILPLLMLIALVIFISSPGPVLFRQKRIGRRGEKFTCFKFRTMATDADERLKNLLATDTEARLEWDRDQKLRNDPRIYPFGRFLRKSSLDELPQLFNVLRGEMSLVGPRPIVEAEIVRYGRYFGHYCAVRPGITGLWQISGRNDVHYRRRIAFDVIYVRKGRVGDNLRILALTVPIVLNSRGSY